MMELKRLFKNPVFLYVLFCLLFIAMLILQESLFRWYRYNKRMTDILWTLQKEASLTDEKRADLTESAAYWQKSTNNQGRLWINYVLFVFCCLAGGALAMKLPHSRCKWPEFKDPLKPEVNFAKEKSNGT